MRYSRISFCLVLQFHFVRCLVYVTALSATIEHELHFVTLLSFRVGVARYMKILSIVSDEAVLNCVDSLILSVKSM